MILYVLPEEWACMEKIYEKHSGNPELINEEIKKIIGSETFEKIGSIKNVKVVITKERKIFNFTRYEEEKGDIIFPVNSLTF